MDRIKATQKKIQGFKIKDPESHEKGIDAFLIFLKSNNLFLTHNLSI